MSLHVEAVAARFWKHSAESIRAGLTQGADDRWRGAASQERTAEIACLGRVRFAAAGEVPHNDFLAFWEERQ